MSRCSVRLFSLLFLVPSLAFPKILDRSLVSVNQEIILESDVEKFIKKSRSKSFQELFGGIDEKILSNRETVIQLLIEEKIIDQQVKKLELQASTAEVDGQIKAITKRTGITSAQLAERIRQLGSNMEEYREGIKRQIERKNLIEREIRPTLEISEQQLKHFYTRVNHDSKNEMQYKIAHILIENKGAKTADRAKAVYKELQEKPEDFDKLVKEYSDDTSTHDTGGLLGEFSASALTKEFREIVPKTAVGAITPPIKTRAGFHIIKVLEKHNLDFSHLPKEKRDQIRNQLMSTELEKRMTMWLERKRSEAHIRRIDQSKKPTE